MGAKVNHRAVLDSGSAILLSGDALQIVAPDGPITIDLLSEGGTGDLRWNEEYRRLTLVDFYNPKGAFVSLASPTGGWSLRVTIQVVGEIDTSTAASIVNWQVLERRSVS